MAGPNAGASKGGYTSSVPLPGRISDRAGPHVAAAGLRVTEAAGPAHRAGLAHQAHEDFRDGGIERLALRSAERGQSLLENVSPRPRHLARRLPAGRSQHNRRLAPVAPSDTPHVPIRLQPADQPLRTRRGPAAGAPEE